MSDALDIFLVCKPGLEPILAAEARVRGMRGVTEEPGGVACAGDWRAVWRANLWLRTADRVLVRLAEFRAMHPAQLDKRARKVDWASVLPRGVPVRVEAVCRASRIYHEGAAKQRVTKAIRDQLGKGAGEPLKILVRIVDDLCTISLDTSGAPLHQRGHKQAVGKAPMRETLAAAFLSACGFEGTGPVVDPMCGSGTFPIEAAEIAAGLAPGRSRRFAFEALPGFDPAAWAAMKDAAAVPAPEGPAGFFGADRDDGAVRMATANAARAGVSQLCGFTRAPVSALDPPGGGPGLVIVNPPYGARIGNRKMLFGLYGALGQALGARFAGWQVGVVTSDDGLARAVGLDLEPGPQVPHGGLKVRLWQGRV